jgi:hypothetical protein
MTRDRSPELGPMVPVEGLARLEERRSGSFSLPSKSEHNLQADFFEGFLEQILASNPRAVSCSSPISTGLLSSRRL